MGMVRKILSETLQFCEAKDIASLCSEYSKYCSMPAKICREECNSKKIVVDFQKTRLIFSKESEPYVEFKNGNTSICKMRNEEFVFDTSLFGEFITNHSHFFERLCIKNLTKQM